MEERIIRLPELITYHQINEVWEESIACFCTKSDMKNISKIPPVLADMFSFIVVEEGMAHYILNYKEYNVQKGDMLLFSPNMLVSLTGCTDDFRCMNLMCERSLFEHMLSSNPAFQTYSYYFCRTDTPVIQLKQEMQTAILKCMEQIRMAIISRNTYQKEIIQSLVYTCMLLVLEVIEERVSSLPVSLGRTERLFHDFMALVVAHYKREHYINFMPAGCLLQPLICLALFGGRQGKPLLIFWGACFMQKPAACLPVLTILPNRLQRN